MKNIGNTENNDQDLTVQNDLTVGNDITTDGLNASSITTDTLNATTTTTATLNATGIFTQTIQASDTITIPTFGSINYGINPFKYSRGTFTPRSRCIVSDGTIFTNENWFDFSNASGQGYYERYGNVVTVYYNATVNFDGTNNDFLDRLRIPVVDNLPFTCASRGGPSIACSGVVTSYSFPDGYAAGVAAPLTITMDAGFQGTIYEIGETIIPKLPPLYLDTSPWTSDGKTLIISCTQSQYSVLGLSIFSGLEGPANNFNVVITGSYTSQFRGTITYFTNE
jgi:hypothetical protein